MTNLYAPFGFKPIRNKGQCAAGLFNDYQIQSSNTELIGQYDLVKQDTSGYIVKCSPTQTPLGFFQGWNYRTDSPFGSSRGGQADLSISPWKAAWNGAITPNSNQSINCNIDDDPFQTFMAQCVGIVLATDRGKLVDMVECPGGPDLTVFNKGKQAVSTPGTYYNITAYTVSNGGTNYVQDEVDLVINGVIQDIRPSDIVVTAGVIQSITLLHDVQGLPTNTPTSTVQPKSGSTGSGAVITTTKSGAQTAAQFRIERILQMPFRQVDSSNRTTGYDLSAPGANALVELSFAKHQRGSTVAAVA